MCPARRVPLPQRSQLSDDEALALATAFRERIASRRSVRDFSDRDVPRALVAECLRAAGSAPSGANLQPWHFAVIGRGPVRARLRDAAEREERAFYEQRAPKEWLEALEPLGTDADKPFLEIAPWLIAIFVQPHGVLPDGRRVKHYYPTESVGIATGLLIAALHEAGLATLTHTPSPMRFLNDICGRPAHERPFLLLVVGHPADGCTVPDIGRKPLEEIATWVPGDPITPAGSARDPEPPDGA